MLMLPLCIALIEDESDRAFMENVYQDYKALMYKIAIDCGVQRQDQDDIINTACLAMCKNVKTLRPMECNALRTYVVLCIRSASINFFKANKRYVLSGDFNSMMYKILTMESNIEDEALARMGIETVKTAICLLKGREREVMIMKYFFGMNNREVADLYGLNIDNVRQIDNRGKQKLSKTLNKDVQEEFK